MPQRLSDAAAKELRVQDANVFSVVRDAYRQGYIDGYHTRGREEVVQVIPTQVPVTARTLLGLQPVALERALAGLIDHTMLVDVAKHDAKQEGDGNGQ